MKNIDIALEWLVSYGHKEKPKHPEESLQRTIQNMRDKGWIDFLGQGEYRLTAEGEKLLLKLKELLEEIIK